MNGYLHPALFVLLALALTACAPFRFGDKKAPVCNELNSEIIFNANTSDTRIAEIQGAQDPLRERSYQKNQCDE